MGLQFRYSTREGTVGGTIRQPIPLLSRGGMIATNRLTSGVHRLFDQISPLENSEGDVEYRCVFVLNTDSVLYWVDTQVWFSEDCADTNLRLAVDPTPASLYNAAAPQAVQIVDEDDTPPGVSGWAAPLTREDGIMLGILPPGGCRAFWLRRTAPGGFVTVKDGVTLRAEGSTVE